jgi:hypothetical protein
MKRTAFLNTLLIGSACLFVLAAAYGALQADRPPHLPMPWSGNGPANYVEALPTDGSLSVAALPAFAKPEIKVQAVPPAKRPQPSRVLPRIPPRIYRGSDSNHIYVPSPQRTPSPGVYKTEPYSCIVVVPGAGLDDCFLVNPGGGHSSMPTVQPELRLVPLAPARK